MRAQANAQARRDAIVASIAALEQQLRTGQALGKALQPVAHAPGAPPPADGSEQNQSIALPPMSVAP